ncbi:MAG: diguanylate cyclase, partial [Methylococcaceae bacterium]|nr:diguanylate cyclase [Methylococcaceae bacterium]
MTLFRQLCLIILLLFLILSGGSLFLGIHNTRQFLNDQLASHAQDTATSLALSLSTYALPDDRAVMESMIDAIFDRGYYREIVLRSVAGEKLIERTAAVHIEDVPAWFVAAIPLQTPKGEALVTSGWNLAGTLTVASHPGYAYQELWRTAVSTLRWIGLCMVIAMALGAILLRRLLRPLASVERQAEAICNRDHPIQETLPRTRELRRVVLAMNRMVTRVREMFEEQSALSEGLRSQLYADPLSGLGNRRYFDAQLEQLLSPHADGGTVALLLFELDGFKDYNDRHGYQAGDELIREAARLTREIAVDHLSARLSGATFAILMSGSSAEDAGDLALRLCGGLERIEREGFPIGASVGHAGIALARPGALSSEVLSDADQALRAAQLIGPNTWELRAGDVPAAYPKGARQWREFLDQALAQGRFSLHFQPVLSLAETPAVLHLEALLRVSGPAGETLP